MAFKYPWGNLQGLNLAWFLEKFNQLREDWATAEAGIEGALDDEIQKAEDALSDVFDARDAAAASATAAAGSATQAGTSATAAQNSATAAASSATSAQTAATNAAASKTAAGNSASAAAGSATTAAGSATAASNSAASAAASESAAGNSASAAAASAASIEGDADAAAASAAAAAQSASDAASSAASFALTDISANIVLNATEFTTVKKSIFKFCGFIFYSLRVVSIGSLTSSVVWENMPISGQTGIDNADPWVRCPQIAVGYSTNIAYPDSVVCTIGDRKLWLKDTQAGWHYEICGFFKTNL